MTDTDAQLAFILVAPQMGENIGAAARVMANFGFDDLRLVAPRDGWPNPKAEAMATGALPILEKTRCFETLGEALSDIQTSYALTARQREMEKPNYEPSEIGSLWAESHEKRALVFGGERSGLSNDDVSLCDAIITIPTKNYSSLNLAQSLAVMSYEASKLQLHSECKPPSPKASSGEVDSFFEHLIEALEVRDFFKAENKKPGMRRNLQNLFKRQNLTSQDIRTLRGVIRCLEENSG